MRRPLLLIIAVAALMSVQSSPRARATDYQTTQRSHSSATSPTDLDLAATYVPVLYFHEHERYRPQDIQVMLDHARLRQTLSGVEATLRDHVTLDDLATAPADAYLDLWYGQEATSSYLNYTAHGEYYDSHQLREAYPITTYAHVVHAADGRVVIQYWFFYYYNDWYNKHEGDWEMAQVELDASSRPTYVVYAQHHGGTVRPWDAVGKIDGTHPQAYVALGSHATYFEGSTLYPQGTDVGSARIDVYDRTGSADPATPTIHLVTDADRDWLSFAGRWGERAFGDFSGPTGPAQKGQQWSDPFTWADLQPSDAAIWYHRNVRIETDALPNTAALTLSDAPDVRSIVEPDRRAQTLIKLDPPDPARVYEMGLYAHQPFSPTLSIGWPDTAEGRLTRREYDLTLPRGGLVTARLCASACDFVLDIDTNGDGTPDRRVPPSRSSSTKVEFDPPESVVFYLPIGQIAIGLLIALFATGVPSAVYAIGVWRLDRLEKEPVKLLAAVFVWGAIPGALVALAARVFVAGAVAPILTESIKAAAIWFVYARYRDEFDDVLDGIVYGAMTGLGFALTTNLFAYAVGFFFGGFEFLRASVLLDGIAFGLNEALYGAVIGIGFGVARWAVKRRVRIGAPILALAIAIGLHLLNDLFRDIAVGNRAWLVVIPLIGTWAGIAAIVVIAFLSIQKEQTTLRRHLQAEADRGTFTPNELFYLSTPARRAQMLFRDMRRGPVELARAVTLQNLAVRLAFRRRELGTMGQAASADYVAADLRQRIAALRPPPGARDNR